MWKYPIKSDKSGYVSLKEAYQWCNQSFFDGFTAPITTGFGAGCHG